jgi:cystathionine beta-lyase
VVAGLAVVNNEDLAKRLGFLQNGFGAILGVQDAWLVLRGIKTLHVRLEQSQKSAIKLAEFLDVHPLVDKVHYPGLESHPQYQIQKEQAAGPGAVLSFELANENALRTFLANVKIPVFAVSLGAVESILSYPAKMSHAAMPQEDREKRGITNSLVRLSVGLENPDDLIKDFTQALHHVEQSQLVLPQGETP